MPKLIGLATRLVTLVAIGALPACAPQAPETPMHDPAADRAAVDAVREREMAALNGAHTDSLASVYADDIVMMPPNEPTVTGGAALRTYVEGMFQQATVSLHGRADDHA
jgi:ketosteroid isomerase-like protein